MPSSIRLLRILFSSNCQVEVVRVAAGRENDQFNYADAARLRLFESLPETGGDTVFARASASDQVDLYAEGMEGADKLQGGYGFDVFYIASIPAKSSSPTTATWWRSPSCSTAARSLSTAPSARHGPVGERDRRNHLWDYGDGGAGNGPTPPPALERDVWSATFDANSGQFTAITLVVDG